MKSYEIGKIINTHGLKGDVIIKPSTDFDRFVEGKSIYVLNPGKYILLIKKVRQHKGGLLVVFDGHEHIEKVESLKGLSLFTDEAPSLSENEFHYDMLINKEVYNQEKVYKGIIVDVIEVPQGHLLRIDIGHTTKLVPFNNQFIKAVGEVVVIEEMEGLL